MWDQPRTCGEYLNDADQAGSTEGSAPHMRGIQGVPVWAGVDGGISPAHAGNTSAGGGAPSVGWDQPRTCGEYHPQETAGGPPNGSAPHMRGIPDRASRRRVRRRISPAHAGNTSALEAAAAGAEDQPRTCGEYARGTGSPMHTGGSAPHMRGILDRLGRGIRCGRISPAHAGNTRPPRLRIVGKADQPRTCGEYQNRGRNPGPPDGSAPHMRGIPCVPGGSGSQ